MLQHPWTAGLFLIMTLAQGGLQGLFVWALRHVLLTLSETGVSTAAALGASAALVFGVWLLRAACTFGGEVLSARLAHRVEHEYVLRVLEKLLRLSVRFFDKHSQGDLLLSMHHDIKGIRFVTIEVGTVILHLSRLAGLAVVAWIMSPLLTTIGLGLVPLALLPAYWLGQRITHAALRERETLAGMTQTFAELSGGIRMIKVNRGEAGLLRKVAEHGEVLFRAVARQALSRSLSRFLFEAVTGVGLVVVLVLGGRSVASGALSWQSLLSLLIAVIAIYGPVMGLLGAYNALNTHLPNLDQVERLLSTPVEVADRPDAVPLKDTPKTIALEHVSFAYDDQVVLRDVSATFHRGESIGIVGPSGAGKSTLFSLLLRLYDPSGGRITLDGRDLRDIRHADLVDKCAIVLQEPLLFLDTVADNIRVARPDAPMEAVVAAAQAANIHDDIMGMERGYDTLLGRRRDARGVSVGQKQRICIAAALLKDAPILFLDEATSNLDALSERAVQVAIDRLMEGRTTFVVAHRLSTLRAVDRILVLEEGRVAGLGRHEELMQCCPTYQRLWRLQKLDGAPRPESEARFDGHGGGPSQAVRRFGAGGE